MPPEARKKKRRTVTLNVDLQATLDGFGSATRPTEAHRRIARNYASPLLLGPPPSEVLLELVTHLYTDEEAELVAQLGPFRARTAEAVAKAAGRPVDEARTVLDRVAFTKMAIVGAGSPVKYGIMPIVPGTFEAVLMTPDLSTRNLWHKRFAELFERLWDDGYMKDYLRTGTAPLHVLPTARLSKTLFAAWPSDHFEEVLEPYDLFAIGQCQCRVAMQLVGKGCDRPTLNCVGVGPMAQLVIERGMMRKADKAEVLEAKRIAEEHGCVTWIGNEMGDRRGNVSCSCCSCCCHALRAVSEFSAPGMISRPHFLPSMAPESCNSCGRCISICPMGAWTATNGDKPVLQTPRCIGCGLCVTTCKPKALELTVAPGSKPPENSWTSLLAKMAPAYAANAARVWARRLFS